MTPADLVTALDSSPAASPPGLALLVELEDVHVHSFEAAPADRLGELIGRQEEIEAAIRELNDYTDQVVKTVNRCLDLAPIPSSRRPLGF
jgi:hypothetical protein